LAVGGGRRGVVCGIGRAALGVRRQRLLRSPASWRLSRLRRSTPRPPNSSRLEPPLAPCRLLRFTAAVAPVVLAPVVLAPVVLANLDARRLHWAQPPSGPAQLMRQLFGDAILQHVHGAPHLVCPGLQNSAQILFDAGCTPPDLSAYEGKTLSFNGLLHSPGENLEVPALHITDLQAPAGDAAQLLQPSFMFAAISGNLGKSKINEELAAESNPKGDRFTASVAYHKTHSGQTSWLRVTAYAYNAVADIFQELEAGASVILLGQLESYTYNDKPRLQLNLRGLQRQERSSAPPAPTSLMRSLPAGEEAADHPFAA